MKLAAIALALLLAGCSSTRDGVAVLPPEKPRLDRPDSASMRKCALPMKIGKAELTQEEVEALLGRNADAQVDCARRHQILINYVNKRDGGLTG